MTLHVLVLISVLFDLPKCEIWTWILQGNPNRKETSQQTKSENDDKSYFYYHTDR